MELSHANAQQSYREDRDCQQRQFATGGVSEVDQDPGGDRQAECSREGSEHRSDGENPNPRNKAVSDRLPRPFRMPPSPAAAKSSTQKPSVIASVMIAAVAPDSATAATRRARPVTTAP